MKLFIDSANIDEIREVASWGILDGVTTNPSLVAKEKAGFEEILREICRIVNGSISAEVVSVEFDAMMREARQLAKLHKNIVVKIPLIKEGLKAIKACSAEGIRTNVTLVFSANQALLAAKCGASIISPFVGRLDDVGHDGMEVVQQIIEIYDNYDYPTEVLVGSVRHPLHVTRAAQMGADIATCPFKVLDQLMKHPLTDVGLKNFLADWEKARKALPEAAAVKKEKARVPTAVGRG